MLLEEVFPGLQPLIKLFCLRNRSKKNLEDAKESLLSEIPENSKSSSMGLKKKRSYVEKLKDKLRINEHQRKNRANFSDPFI